MSTALLISDLHLTANPRDEYRWRLFPWLRGTLMQHAARTLFILGDLTEAKDYHSARLVNRIVTELLRLYREGGLYKIYILRGNHDGLDPNCAFFRFLGQFPSISYIDIPYMVELDGRNVLMLPHAFAPQKAWAEVEFSCADLIFMHATVSGAEGENGMRLGGLPVTFFRRCPRARIYSGDVHVPQKIGPVEYVGAPYSIRFGDQFQGRALLLENYAKATPLYPGLPKRWTFLLSPGAGGKFDAIRDQVRAGDQIKVRLRLAPHEYMDWQKLKQQVQSICRETNTELCSMELERVAPAPGKLVRRGQRIQGGVTGPNVVFNSYCVQNEIESHVAETGLSLLRKSQEGA